MELNIYRPFLAETTFYHLKNCVLTIQEEQYFSSAVWGAVFLEAFLYELGEELKIPKSSQDDLNGKIQQLRQYSKNHNENMPDIPDEILKRCDDIRNTRNRLVHHTGLPKKTLHEDAKYLFAGIRVILDWYRGFKVLSEDTAESKPAGLEEKEQIPVYLSTITPHNSKQAYFIDTLCYKLSELGIKIVRAELSIYDKRNPIGKISKTISGCKGIIVLGLERSHAYFLKDKEGAESEVEEIHRKYSSGWLHLEAGIANALGKDIFELCQHDICSDGIFDRSWNSYSVLELKSLDENSEELGTFLRHMKEWVENRLKLIYCNGY